MICYSYKEQNSKQTFKSFDLTIYFYEQTMQKQQALHFWNAGHEFNVWSVSQNWKNVEISFSLLFGNQDYLQIILGNDWNNKILPYYFKVLVLKSVLIETGHWFLAMVKGVRVRLHVIEILSSLNIYVKWKSCKRYIPVYKKAYSASLSEQLKETSVEI